jgi:hypothetical protein
LECFDAQGEDFLSRIVTGDETWAQHYEPEMKREVSGVASSAVIKKKEVQDNSFLRKVHDHRLLGR